MLIAEIQIKYEEYQTLNKLIEILNNHKEIIARSDTNYMFPAIYTNASLFLCRINRFEDALVLSSSGIRFSKEYNNLSSMGRLYYVKSHSLLNLGRKREVKLKQLDVSLVRLPKTILKNFECSSKRSSLITR